MFDDGPSWLCLPSCSVARYQVKQIWISQTSGGLLFNLVSSADFSVLRHSCLLRASEAGS